MKRDVSDVRLEASDAHQSGDVRKALGDARVVHSAAALKQHRDGLVQHLVGVVEAHRLLRQEALASLHDLGHIGVLSRGQRASTDQHKQVCHRGMQIRTTMSKAREVLMTGKSSITSSSVKGVLEEKSYLRCAIVIPTIWHSVRSVGIGERRRSGTAALARL